MWTYTWDCQKYGSLYNYVCCNCSKVTDSNKGKDNVKLKIKIIIGMRNSCILLLINFITNGAWLNTSVNYL